MTVLFSDSVGLAATHSCVSLDELRPAHVEPPQLLGEAPAGLGICGLHQELPHLVQVGLAGAPLRDTLRCQLEADSFKVTAEIKSFDILVFKKVFVWYLT